MQQVLKQDVSFVKWLKGRVFYISFALVIQDISKDKGKTLLARTMFSKAASGIKIMARIAGVDLPENKRIDIGLTYIFGIGRANVISVIKDAGVDAAKRIKELTEDEINRIQKVVEKIKVEGDLRQEIEQNIKRLEEIGSFRGSRHRKGLPSRGQRTRSNARTKRGKRKTVGTVRKEVVASGASGTKTGGSVAGAAPAPASSGTGSAPQGAVKT